MAVEPQWFSEDAVKAFGELERAFIYGTFAFLSQPLVVTTVERGPRYIRRQLKARDVPPDLSFHVVRLRRPQHARTEPGATLERNARWIVQGHWRSQWYPSAHQHKPLWIHTYVKGPEGLMVPLQVFALFRRSPVLLVVEGGHYGWPETEGVGAVYTYPTRSGCAVIGGVPFEGGYVFGDFCTREIHLLRDGDSTLIGTLAEPITSFALDGDSLVAVGYGGTVYHYDPVSRATAPSGSATLSLEWESGDVQVYRVTRRTIHRSEVSGRTWPWQGRN